MAVDQAKDQVVEAAEEVTDAPPEERSAAIDALVEETTRHREMMRLIKIVEDEDLPIEERQKAMDEARTRFVVVFHAPDRKPVRTVEELRRVSPTVGSSAAPEALRVPM